MKRRDVYLKLTRHNGRAGAHGTYNPKHNDRSFNLANSEHIDPERAKGNIYWDCFHGFRSTIAPQDPDDLAATFSEVERQFYETHYTAFIESQNERNAKIRHTERNRSIPDLLSSRKTCPEETIYQLGTLDEHASAEDLLNIVTEFIKEFKAKFGEHVHVLDWALHLDESTPHIHERHVFDCENKYSEVAPQQEKALEALGFGLPDPAKPLSRRNNRKITFDAACRKMLFEIAKRHGLELEEEAEYGNRKYLEKQDFILAKQKEQLAAQQSKLDELTLKVSDMETLLENVSAAAYDKAVEVVTDVVRTETRREDIYAFLEDYAGDRVCSKQLYAEALGNTNIPAEWETRAICEIMNTGISRGDIQGWQAHKTAKRYPKYGVQKGWERVTSPETGAENFSEITDAEAKQLGFPF